MDNNMEKKNVKKERVFEMTVGEYFRELELMEKQYGCEEELYPFINMFLRNGKDAKDISIRSVANGRKAKKVVGRDLISGCISFPDIAILKVDFDITKGFDYNKDKILGCVEVKQMNDSLLDIVEGKEGQTIKIKVMNALYFNIKEKGLYQYCLWDFPEVNELSKKSIKELNEEYEISGIGKDEFKISKRIKSDEKETIIRNSVKHCGWKSCGENNSKDLNKFDEINKKYIAKYCEIKYKGKSYLLTNKENGLTDAGQLFGELFWYGKVLYTNGLVWKYLKISSKSEEKRTEELIKELRSEINKKHIIGDEEWFEALKSKVSDNEEIYITCENVANLTKCYEEYKKNKVRKTDKNKDDFSIKQGLEEESCEWKKLMLFLDKINWIL